jgi:tetratricopeptide (TPR) repeat protein
VGPANNTAATTHNATVPNRPLVRAATATLCAAGVLAGAVTYRSETRYEDAFRAYFQGKPRREYADKFAGSRVLNPSIDGETAEATARVEIGERGTAVALLRRAARREPENARVWAFWTRLALKLGRPAEARRHWDRARELNPRLPAQLPPSL